MIASNPSIAMLNLEELDIESLDYCLLKDRNQLPSFSAVYICLSDCMEVLYIGKSISLKCRWASHHLYSLFLEMPDVRIAWVQTPSERLLLVEAQLIDFFRPRLNKAKSNVAKQIKSCTRKKSGIECRLIQVMAEKRIGRGELAEKTGISLATISKLRSNVYPTRIELNTIDKICKVLACNFGDLFVRVES